MKRAIGWCSILLLAAGAAATAGWYLQNHVETPPVSVSRPPAPSASVTTDLSNNYLEALARYRNNQPSHWRHVLLQH